MSRDILELSEHLKKCWLMAGRPLPPWVLMAADPTPIHDEYMEQPVEEEEEMREFNRCDYEELVEVVAAITKCLVPEVEFDVTGRVNSHSLKFIFHIPDESRVGLFLGRKMVNIKILQCFIRAQQIYPHDRYIKIIVEKGDTRIPQIFTDENVSKAEPRMDRFEQDADRAVADYINFLGLTVEQEGLSDVAYVTFPRYILEMIGIWEDEDE